MLKILYIILTIIILLFCSYKGNATASRYKSFRTAINDNTLGRLSALWVHRTQENVSSQS